MEAGYPMPGRSWTPPEDGRLDAPGAALFPDSFTRGIAAPSACGTLKALQMGVA